MSINIIYAGINKDASITFGSHQFGALAEELSQSKGAIELMENWKAKAHGRQLSNMIHLCNQLQFNYFFHYRKAQTLVGEQQSL